MSAFSPNRSITIIIIIISDKGEWLEDIERGDSSSASFLACVEECISERESRRFEEGLNTKVKLYIILYNYIIRHL